MFLTAFTIVVGSLFASLSQRDMLKINNRNEVILMTDYQEKLNEA